jgi:hypothetical protein
MGMVLDTVTSQGTAIGAALAATTIASGDSFTVRNCDLNSKVWMLTYWSTISRRHDADPVAEIARQRRRDPLARAHRDARSGAAARLAAGSSSRRTR